MFFSLTFANSIDMCTEDDDSVLPCSKISMFKVLSPSLIDYLYIIVLKNVIPGFTRRVNQYMFYKCRSKFETLRRYPVLRTFRERLSSAVILRFMEILKRFLLGRRWFTVASPYIWRVKLGLPPFKCQFSLGYIYKYIFCIINLVHW